MNDILSADRPQTDPAQDLFGYAPFAETLTKALCNYGSSDPLVLGLYGAWGSGKSTILKFICHNLEAMPKKERPIVIEFNPWWFSGQEHLARVFLGQLQAVLPKKYEAIKKLGELLGNFSESIGEAIDVVAPTGGWGKRAGKLAKSFSKRPPKDVPALKEKICNELKKSTRRIVIMIDDIDRLDAEEMRQLFTVIKALADFPNVIYLLAFDQDVVVRAIEKSSGMPGREYLEKIIQASFVVPQVDRTVLLGGLKTRLDEILKGTPEYLCEHGDWHFFMNDGLDKLFTVPRDVVRFCNTVSVTYPAMRDKVHAFDFIAIEAIRFFLPKLYMYIRENDDKFVYGYYEQSVAELKLREIIAKFVPENIHKELEQVLRTLFPYFCHDADECAKLIKKACAIGDVEFFPRYFCFDLVSKLSGSMKVLQWLKEGGDANALEFSLRLAKVEGLKSIYICLAQMAEHIKKGVEINSVPVMTSVLLNIGDMFIDCREGVYGYIACKNRNLIIENIRLLAKLLSLNARLTVLEQAIRSGDALEVQCELLRDVENAGKKGIESFIPEEKLFEFKVLWLKKVDERVAGNTLLSHPNLECILAAWRDWSSDTSKIREWCAEVTKSDDGMFAFIEKFIHVEYVACNPVTSTDSIDLQSMKNYIKIVDFRKRISALQRENRIALPHKKIADLFLKSLLPARRQDS